MIRIFDKKMKKIHIIFFELMPFFKILDPKRGTCVKPVFWPPSEAKI